MDDAGGVLVGVDFSDSSREAVEYGSQLAGALRCVVHLVHAWNPSAWEGMNPGLDARFQKLVSEARAMARDELDQWVVVAQDVPRGVIPIFEEGAASKVLPRVAAREGSRLVVTGRHGHASLAHVFLGSVSERVALGAPCPVVVIPKGLASLTPPKKLLAGIDFSRDSLDALRFAVDLARDLSATDGLVCVHVLRRGREARADPVAYQERVVRAQRNLDRVVAGLGKVGVPIDTRVEDGHPDQRLMSLATELKSDCLVVGVRGSGHPASPHLGGTTLRVLKQSKVPVLVWTAGSNSMEPGLSD